MMDSTKSPIDACDRRLVLATQAGVPLVSRPYAAIGVALGLSEETVLERMTRLAQLGVIRRIGAVPNHYKLGYRANGMSVWDIDDGQVDELGEKIGALPFVTHCYRRPRRLPEWPYNLFVMVHGQDRAEVERKVGVIAALVGKCLRQHAVLYSKRILKKTGVRLPDRSPQGV